MIDTTTPEFKAAFDLEAKRRDFIKQNLPDLPEPYHAMIGNDPATWTKDALCAAKKADGDVERYRKETAEKPPAGDGFLKMPGTPAPIPNAPAWSGSLKMPA